RVILISFSFCLSLISFIIAYEEFFSYREFIDKLFPKEKSENIVAIFSPEIEKRATLIVSAHHDSAREFYLLYKFKQGYVVFVLSAIILLYMMFGWTAWNLITSILIFFGITSEASWIFLISKMVMYIIAVLFIPALFMFKFTGGNVVPGARDNLAGCVSVLGVARYVSKHRPKYVEIRTITFGSEEAGLRGSKRYAAVHKQELSKDAYALNLDGIGRHNVATVVSAENTTRTKHDADWVQFVANSAKKTAIEGMKVAINPDPFGGGGTDAISLTRAGIPATTIHMFTPLKDHLENYHTRRDLPSFVDKEAIRDSIAIIIEVIKDLDREKGKTE
ncbi:MAG: M28 family metallopeptidase, partial [Promethearchaeota archaeon]